MIDHQLSKMGILASCLLLSFSYASGQTSGTLSVSATANPWRAGGFVLPDDPGGFGIGDVPPEITFAANSSAKITVSASGIWSCGLASAGPGGGPCGPFPNVNVIGIGGLTGIQTQQMTLVGVFLDSHNPPDVPTASGIGVVFPIGEGGTFDIPPTATRLVLGMPDECTGGATGLTASCYGDNSGSVSVTYNLAKQFHISLSAFIMPPIIPVGFPPGPGACNTRIPFQPPQLLRYSGDDRTFAIQPPFGSYRIHQEITVDQSGKIEGGPLNDSGVSRSWAPDSFDSNLNLLPEALADDVLDDCHFLEERAKASTANMLIDVVPVSDSSFSLHLTGKASDPLVSIAHRLAPVQWDLTLQIDSSVSPASFHLQGFHTCYPAVELYVTDVGSKTTTNLIQFSPNGNSFWTLLDCLTRGVVGHHTNYNNSGGLN